jgi:hypothetical protein
VRSRIKALSINRTQALVLGLFVLAWIGLVLTLILASEVYAAALGLRAGGDSTPLVLFLVALSSFLVLLSLGTVRRWRWTFWLILVAFLFGILRVPVAILELSGWVEQQGPGWYVLLQGVLGILQFGIAVAMLVGLRRGGAWAAF